MHLIIHHWDTDGICSAALLADKETVNMTPRIGNYFLNDDEIKEIKHGGFEEIIVADMAFHEDTMRCIAAIAPVTVYDHHFTHRLDGITYINPISDGGDEEEYPSASWVIAKACRKTDSILAVLGAVGDLEERIKQTRFYPTLERAMHRHCITFNELHEMVECIDANYKIGDKKAVEQAVRDLAYASDIPSFIRGNSAWHGARDAIEKEIKQAVAGTEERRGGVRVKYMDCPYNVISAVARRIWDKKNPVIVVNQGFFPEKYQIYVRADNCLPLISMANARGYVAGGKKNVMGAIVPAKQANTMVDDLVAALGGTA